MKHWRASTPLATIIDDHGRVEGRELSARIDAREAALRQAGCREGSCALVLAGNEAEFFVNLFALWRIGAAVVPLSPQSAPAEVARVEAHSGCSFVCRGPVIQNTFPVSSAPPVGIALLLYTSGTTSAPKGVMISYAALAAKLAVLAEQLPSSILERTLCLVPVSFGHGLIGNSLPALLAGGELHLTEVKRHEHLVRLGNVIDELGITFFSSVPAMWATVLPLAEPSKAGTLRRVFCASAGLPVGEWNRVKAWLGGGVDLRNVYGLTEAASWVSALPEGALYDQDGLVGKGWGCEFRISADGEVLLKAPYLMSGYHGESTALEDGFLRTGDLGVLEQGSLHLLGRLKEQINRGGMKVSSAEVELALRAHASVDDAAVFSLPDGIAGELVAAAVVTSRPLTARELREHCRAHLSEFKIPQRIFFVAAIPRNERGKIDGAALRRLAQS
jgi:acyl-CoA synthetase (AMP-forming)/AMP-acid ligase II